MGGLWASLKHKELLTKIDGLDSVVVGEGEETTVSLVDALNSGRTFSGISGLAYRSENGEIRLVPRQLFPRLDELPTPERQHSLEQIRKAGAVSIVFSRGCYGRCTFCHSPAYRKLCGGKIRRLRNPVQVVDEMEQIVKTTGVDLFLFVDDDFLGLSEEDRSNCIILAQEILRRKLALRFTILCQAKGIDEDILKLLREAGLINVNIGIESWADTQLKRYGKLSTRNDNLKALDILIKLGVPVQYYLIPLDPYVSKNELITNLYEVKRIGLEYIYQIQFCKKIYLDEYTSLTNRCRSDGLIPEEGETQVDQFYLQYIQKNGETTEYVHAADEIENVFRRAMWLLEQKENEWDVRRLIISRIAGELKNRLFYAFLELVENEDESRGSRRILSQFESDLRQIERACSEIDEGCRSGLNFSVRIGGQTISLSPSTKV